MIIAFEFIFETPQNLPPPFSHTYRLLGKFDHIFSLNYELFYTGRDQLSTEEIWEEGFSEDDNVQYQSELPSIWKNEILRLLKNVESTSKNPESHENRLFLRIYHQHKDNTQKVQELIPKNSKVWEQTMQELIQALLEIQKIELPLVLTFLQTQRSHFTKVIIEVLFAERKVKLLISNNQHKNNTKRVGWQEMRQLVDMTFNNEFDLEKAQTKFPKTYGFFINLGDEFWFEAEKSVLDISQKNTNLNQLEKFILKLSQ